MTDEPDLRLPMKVVNDLAVEVRSMKGDIAWIKQNMATRSMIPGVTEMVSQMDTTPAGMHMQLSENTREVHEVSGQGADLDRRVARIEARLNQ